MVLTEKSISVLWQDYLFLTKEMNKFLDRQDSEMFLELLSQRERLQSMIENKPSQDFIDSKQGQEMCTEIAKINHIMADKVQYILNMEQKNQSLSRAYDGLNNPTIGLRMDWKS
ncbi:MAG: hypothetical protein K0R78_2141 [Pelosinus sp.]|jgi:hypothetical protein|nr:hypothetical protein [Pelosinus sp.]